MALGDALRTLLSGGPSGPRSGALNARLPDARGGARPSTTAAARRRHRPGRADPLLTPGLLGAFLVTLPCAAATALGQVVPDTVPGGAPGDTAAAADTAAGRPPVLFPSEPAAGPSPGGGLSWECDRRCILSTNALTLADLLESDPGGGSVLRSRFFAGPHHLRDGLLGPGFHRVRVSGRPVEPLLTGSTDLTRIPVAFVDAVRVEQGPGGTTVDLTPIRHREARAYSRISAGTGDPGVNMIRALYANSLGRHMSVSTGIDLLNTGDESGGDRFDFWGSAAWMPGEGGGGVELRWRSQTLDPPETPEVQRQSLTLHGRGRLAPDVVLHVSAGEERWSPSDAGAPAPAQEDPSSTTVERTARGATLLLRAPGLRPALEATLETWDGGAYPAIRADAELTAPVAPGLTATLGGRGARWNRFDAWSVRAGLRWSPDLGVGLDAGVGAARGRRGVPRPAAGTADSLTFTGVTATVAGRLGPASARVRGLLQDVSRQLPYGPGFDGELPAGPAARITGVEGTLETDLLPLGWLIESAAPLRLRGGWRYYRVLEGAGAAAGAAPGPLYLPRSEIAGGLVFRDQFFQDELEVRMELGGRRRGAVVTPDPGSAETATLEAMTRLEWDLMIRIQDVRIWWRTDNLRDMTWADLAGRPYPPRVNVFGVKWEFFN